MRLDIGPRYSHSPRSLCFSSNVCYAPLSQPFKHTNEAEICEILQLVRKENLTQELLQVCCPSLTSQEVSTAPFHIKTKLHVVALC